MTNRTALLQQIDSLEKAVALPEKNHQLLQLSEDDRRLIEVYMAYIRKTGQYEFSTLKDIAQQAYEIASDRESDLLLPRKIKFLCNQAVAAVKQIDQHSENLRDGIDLLGQHLIYGGDSAISISQIAKSMNHELAGMSSAIAVIEDLVNKYGPSGKNWFMRSLSAFGSDTEQEETEYFIRYHKNSLRYIISFLEYHLQPDVIQLEFPQGTQWNVYASRLLSYCNSLSRHSQNLSDKMQETIRESAPDADFSQDENRDEDNTST